jgi:hypothetical protein
VKQQFLKDIQKLYNYILEQKANINKLYEYLEQNKFDKLEIIDKFASHLDLNMTDELRVALITRLVSLRDDGLVQVLKKLKKDEKEIIELQELAYKFVSKYWLEVHKNTLNFINENNLLTPFYRAIFNGVYEVGIAMTAWQTSWTKQIINGVNKELLKENDNSDIKVMKFLEENNLFDLGHGGDVADRSYSVLIKKDGIYESQAYIKAFKKEVTNTIDKLEDFVDTLIELEDEVYDQKWDYILYLQAIIKALGEDDTNILVSRWADVDRAWMKIKSPIQIGHPLEYYEDHFRKAVALEWDIRLSSPTLQTNNQRVDKLRSMFENIYLEVDINKEYKDIYDFSLKSLNKVQLYLGRPALFFAAQFNGLFSAQVVPNDEIVSREDGKKIFAFSDEILQAQRAKPFLKLSREIFGQDFLTEERKALFDNSNDSQKWHQVYDITTIGHEYGHILWCDDTTEAVMNKKGNFKNIEEFKATTGGLVSFFIDKSEDEKSSERQLLLDTIKRAVSLIAWMEVDEVQPYYCEGLIHLSGLFKSNVLTWDDLSKRLTVNINSETTKVLKMWYIDTYKSLAKHYVTKQEATIWLNIYATKDDKYFIPKDENIKSFVKYYFERYKAIGQELDSEDKKENYDN